MAAAMAADMHGRGHGRAHGHGRAMAQQLIKRFWGPSVWQRSFCTITNEMPPYYIYGGVPLTTDRVL